MFACGCVVEGFEEFVEFACAAPAFDALGVELVESVAYGLEGVFSAVLVVVAGVFAEEFEHAGSADLCELGLYGALDDWRRRVWVGGDAELCCA